MVCSFSLARSAWSGAFSVPSGLTVRVFWSFPVHGLRLSFRITWRFGLEQLVQLDCTAPRVMATRAARSLTIGSESSMVSLMTLNPWTMVDLSSWVVVSASSKASRSSSDRNCGFRRHRRRVASLMPASWAVWVMFAAVTIMGRIRSCLGDSLAGGRSPSRVACLPEIPSLGIRFESVSQCLLEG